MVELELPQDIVLEILSWLPVKSLLRFKCVRKAWRSLISSPQFAKAHLKRAMERDQQRALLTSCPLKSIDYEAYSEDHDTSNATMEFDYPMGRIPIFECNIVGSCDGLVCLLIDNDSLILWNPSIRKSTELPRERNFVGIHVFYGICYDASIDDHKVLRGVRSCAPDGSGMIRVEVLALKNNTWRMVQVQNPNIPLKESGKYINGALHWLEKNQIDTNERCRIVSFNIEDEKFEERLQLPELFSQDIVWSGLGISSNHLFVYGIHGLTMFELWMMEESGVASSWSKLLSFPLINLPDEECGHSLSCIAKDGKLLIDICSWRLFLYDPKEARTETLFEQNFPYAFEVTTYIESLVSPHVDHNINEGIDA